MKTKHVIYGLLAQFDTPDELLVAAEKVRDAGYTRHDTFAPFPIHGLSEAMGLKKSHVSLLVLMGGLTGCFLGFFMQYYANVISYPLDIAGRPLNSWPAFIPVTYECTILFSAFTAGLGMLMLNGLPKPYNPLFNVPNFVHASRDKFFVCIEAKDSKFSLENTREFLQGLNPSAVVEVPE